MKTEKVELDHVDIVTTHLCNKIWNDEELDDYLSCDDIKWNDYESSKYNLNCDNNNN